nr:MAG TPA: hypothetical protein [Caudoviricetes sp.]
MFIFADGYLIIQLLQLACITAIRQGKHIYL